MKVSDIHMHAENNEQMFLNMYRPICQYMGIQTPEDPMLKT